MSTLMPTLEHINRSTRFAETELARPPRVFAWMSLLIAGLLAVAASWAFVARIDRVSRAPVRIRPST